LLSWKERCIGPADRKFRKKEIIPMVPALHILVLLLTLARWPDPASKIAALSSSATVVTWSGIPIQGPSPEKQSQAHNRIIRIWKAHADRVRVAKFSPDGARMVSASDDLTARIWDVLSGQLIATCIGHKGVIFDAEFSHDGKHVLTISEDGTARIWEAETGKPLATFEGRDDYILFAFFCQIAIMW
jgi:WD40 repeat protein